MRLRSVASAPWYLARAAMARRYARRRGLDMSFASYGVGVGRRLLRRSPRAALELLLVPVHDIRYWEFGFVWPRIAGGEHLDVASPRLLALRRASEKPSELITVINPDTRDTAATRSIAQRLGLRNIHVLTISVASLPDRMFDSVWSISVVEHIAQDTQAVARMWASVRPGGRLLMTVPVDRKHWDEYRDTDVYQLSRAIDGPIFFQRFYTEETIRLRLLSATPGAQIELGWWGETRPGTFTAHVGRWVKHGFRETVNDPRHVVDGYRAFNTWADMPGFGVCGIAATKPG